MEISREVIIRFGCAIHQIVGNGYLAHLFLIENSIEKRTLIGMRYERHLKLEVCANETAKHELVGETLHGHYFTHVVFFGEKVTHNIL